MPLHLNPTYRKESGAGKTLPLNDIGCVSYLTVGWLTATMWKAFKVKGKSLFQCTISSNKYAVRKTTFNDSIQKKELTISTAFLPFFSALL